MAEARAALGEYLGTHADNVVYVTNVTAAVNIVEFILRGPARRIQTPVLGSIVVIMQVG